MTNEELIKSKPKDFWWYMFIAKPFQTRSGTDVKIATEEMKYKRKGRGKSRKHYGSWEGYAMIHNIERVDQNIIIQYKDGEIFVLTHPYIDAEEIKKRLHQLLAGLEDYRPPLKRIK